MTVIKFYQIIRLVFNTFFWTLVVLVEDKGIQDKHLCEVLWSMPFRILKFKETWVYMKLKHNILIHIIKWQIYILCKYYHKRQTDILHNDPYFW